MRTMAHAPAAQRLFMLAARASALAGCLALAPALPAAAQAGNGAVYAVTYLDVSTDWTAQGAGLIRQYRDGTRREPGNLEFTVLQETTRPNRFAIVEGWRDQKAMDAHTGSAEARNFAFILEAIRNSPPNRHVLDAFAAAAHEPAAPGALYMVQHVDIAFRGMGGSVQGAFKTLAAASQKEAGALRFDVYEEPDPHQNHFSVVGVWTSDKAYEAHESAAYTRQYRAVLAQTGQGNFYDQRLYKVVD